MMIMQSNIGMIDVSTYNLKSGEVAYNTIFPIAPLSLNNLHLLEINSIFLLYKICVGLPKIPVQSYALYCKILSTISCIYNQ